jgi:hypothetical protein
MTLEEMENRIKTLETEVRTLNDVREIEILQRAYGYYLEHWMSGEVIDCFADSPDVVLSLYEGTWLGKDGIRRYFGRERVDPEFLHQVMQVSPIVHVNPDGKTAKGRWYSWGAVAAPQESGVRQFFMGGIYESEYVKQDGKWRILKLAYSLHIAADPREGWVRPGRLPGADRSAQRRHAGPTPDIAPHGMDSRYPSGYIFPFHFTHPVTGKETSEAKRNAALKFIPNLFSRERDRTAGDGTGRTGQTGPT